jgi:hypothetical protein
MLTLLHPYYNHHEMMKYHFEMWSRWQAGVKERVHIVLVDDCSKEKPFQAKDYNIPRGLNLRVYRIKDDILWNTPGVKNLGFTVAETPWVIAADCDLMLEGHEASKMLGLDFSDKRTIYWPWCHRVTGKIGERRHPPHCNSFIMSRELFWEAGGFDEDFAGKWGYEDAHFWKVAVGALPKIKHVELKEVFFNSHRGSVGQLPESKVRFGANSNERKFLRKRKRINSTKAHGGNPLRFEWERIL